MDEESPLAVVDLTADKSCRNSKWYPQGSTQPQRY